MWKYINDEAELQALLAPPSAPSTFRLVLKHSARCAFSAMAKNRIERRMDDRIEYYLIDVLGAREISNSLASLTGVKHESPQAFLFEGSTLLDVKSHLSIDPAEMTRRIDSIARC